MGMKAIALGFQLAAQYLVVINLAIECNVQAAIGCGHGLCAGFAEVDDREAAVGEADALVRRNPQPGAVRTAGDHRFADAQEFFAVDRWGRLSVSEDACYAAHGENLGNIECGGLTLLTGMGELLIGRLLRCSNRASISHGRLIHRESNPVWLDHKRLRRAHTMTLVIFDVLVITPFSLTLRR